MVANLEQNKNHQFGSHLNQFLRGGLNHSARVSIWNKLISQIKLYILLCCSSFSINWFFLYDFPS